MRLRPTPCQNLTAEVNLHLGPGLAHHHDQAGVRHDHGIRLQSNHRRHVVDVVLDLVAVRKDVGHQKELGALGVRGVNALLQDLNVAKVVVAHPQAVARLARINGIGAKGQRRFQHGQRAGRGQQFGGFHEAIPVVNRGEGLSALLIIQASWRSIADCLLWP